LHRTQNSVGAKPNIRGRLRHSLLSDGCEHLRQLRAQKVSGAGK